jgi:hypothetical protein
MTPEEWENSDDPQAMLQFLRDSGRLTERKGRLFAAACCRRVWHLMTDERSRRAVEVAELFADQAANTKMRAAARLAASQAAYAAREAYCEPARVGGEPARQKLPQWRAAGAATYTASASPHEQAAAAWAAEAAEVVAELTRGAATREARGVERQAQAALIRDLFNPFNRVSLAPAWVTPTAVALGPARP